MYHMKKQTAVEWLIENMQGLNPGEYADVWNKLFEDAKRIERQQILDAITCNQNGLLRRKTVLDAIKYYNDTYGK